MCRTIQLTGISIFIIIIIIIILMSYLYVLSRLVYQTMALKVLKYQTMANQCDNILIPTILHALRQRLNPIAKYPRIHSLCP
jgi:lipopolysaccharide/colanic/teichoic acid biosynthesis glycosyltransferase